MIIGFSKHGTGGGRAPVRYLLDPTRAGREECPPELVAGDAQQTRELIDSLTFKHKYTSGVLSFAPNEQITPEMEKEIIERFEQVAFAGLEPNQYKILWVRHKHAGHHELHFLTPRVELSTGKSMNIKPPGARAQEHFDDLRSEINARYGLADPTDPARARGVSEPDHELKIAAEALRSGQKPRESVRVLIDALMSQRAVQGLVRSQNDAIEQLKELGFDVPRSGKDYITVSEPESGQRWRLKGALYAREWDIDRALEAAARGTERDYSKPDPAAARSYAERVERHISARAEYNKGRYRTADTRHRLEHAQEQNPVAERDRVEPLAGYLARELGDYAIPLERDHRSAADPENTGTGGRQSSNLEVRHSGETVHQDRPEGSGIREKRGISDNRGVLNDRARNPLAERIEAFGASVQRAVSSIRASAKSVTDHVRDYLNRERQIEAPSVELEQATRRVERAAQAVVERNRDSGLDLGM